MRASSILLVDDHALVRTALVKILSQEFPGRGVNEATNAAEAKRILAEGTCELAILDVGLPGQGGIELLEYIHDSYPAVRALVVSGHPEEAFAVRALRAGALGVLSKGDPDCVGLLCQAVRKILAGGRFIGAGAVELLAAELNRGSEGPLHRALSNREFDILLRIGGGGTVGSIARDLNLSVKTVSTYRARLLEKMHMSNNAELMEYVIRNQLIS